MNTCILKEDRHEVKRNSFLPMATQVPLEFFFVPLLFPFMALLTSSQEHGALLWAFLFPVHSSVSQLCLPFHKALISSFGRTSLPTGIKDQNKLRNVCCHIFPKSTEICTDVWPLVNPARPLGKDCCFTAGFWQGAENNSVYLNMHWKDWCWN